MKCQIFQHNRKRSASPDEKRSFFSALCCQRFQGLVYATIVPQWALKKAGFEWFRLKAETLECLILSHFGQRAKVSSDFESRHFDSPGHWKSMLPGFCFSCWFSAFFRFATSRVATGRWGTDFQTQKSHFRNFPKIADYFRFGNVLFKIFADHR